MIVTAKTEINFWIITTTALRLLEEHFKFSIQEGPIYISDIHWKFEFQKNDIKLNTLENQVGNCNKFSTGKSGWLCKSC